MAYAVAEPKELPDKKPKLTQQQELQLRWQQLENEYSSWKPHYQEISTFLLPRNGRFFVQDRNRGGRRHNSIYDNSGTRALRTCGSGLMAGATSPARPWVRVITGDPRLDRQYSVRSWLDEVTRMILRVFNRSNAYRVLHTMYEELAAFGTAACIVTEDFETVIHLTPLTCGEYRLASDYKGNVNTCYRRFEKTVAETVGEFGRENCSTNVQQAYDNGMLGNTVTIIHASDAREDRAPREADASTRAGRP